MDQRRPDEQGTSGAIFNDAQHGPERSPISADRRKFFSKEGVIVGGFAGLALIAGGLVLATNGGDDGRPTPRAAEALAAADEACGETFAIQEYEPNAENRWFSDGMQEIKEAKTDAEARDAAYAWVDKVKRFPHFLAAAGESLTDQESVDPDSLHADGCINEEGLQLISKIELALGESEIRKTEAPAEGGINTGANEDGEVTKSAKEGLHGNRNAIEITRKNPDGQVCKVYVLERCGQFYTFETCMPNVPEGPTDQDQPEVTTSVPGEQTTTPTTFPLKTGDGKQPGDATRGRGDPDPVGAGQGPAGQQPDNRNYLPTERTPDTQALRPNTTAPPQPLPTYGGSPPTTGQQVEASPQPVITIRPQPNNTTPPKPGV